MQTLLAIALIQPLPSLVLESPIKGPFGRSQTIEVEIGKEAVAKLKAAKPDVKAWNAILRVVVAGSPKENETRPAVAGNYSVEGTVIRFVPQFPYSPQISFYVRFDPAKIPGGSTALAADKVFLTSKPPPGPPVSISSVFPSANRLPENALRFYIHFSGQMTHGDIYRKVKLIRDDGVEIKSPFLELDEELWSADGLRVTMLFHPGRVKRELVPREEDGPILEEGRSYTLVFGREWKDAEGRPLAKEFRKAFTVGPPEESPIDPGTWSLMPPRAGTDAPLIVRLAKPVDRALLASTLSVVDSAGKPVPGETTVGGGERVVTFVPSSPWKRGAYRLSIDPRLEDVCGNRVGEPFEIDATKPRPSVPAAAFVKPFAVR